MKAKISLEFPIKASGQLLFQYISTSSGLSEWFADNVNSKGNVYTFFWGENYEEKAKLAQKKQDEKVKFRWLDEDGIETDRSFEFIIDIDEITNDVVLIINEMCEDDEIEDQKLLWDKQIAQLKKIIGSN